MTARIFGAPHRYIQGPNALNELGTTLRSFGNQPLLVADSFVLEILQDRLNQICADAGLSPDIRSFDGEITYAAIEDLAAMGGPSSPGIVVGLGGGKALDAAKAVAMKLGLPVVTVPTIASNDSPTSGSIAIYDENHAMVSIDRMPRSPEAVIVDTALIASAPHHFLRAGIGDAITKKFEADGCAAGTGVTPFGTRPLRTALAIADCCYHTLRAHGAAAMHACKRNEVTDDLEAVIEATILMSGLGFENGGLSLAHSMTRGLVKTRGVQNAIHGDQVAYALLVQWAFEDRADADIHDLMAFYHDIGLPTCLAELGLDDPTGADIQGICAGTMTAPHLLNLDRAIDADAIRSAIGRIETLSKEPTS